jgi:CubicO group peptidase (beta-lactamase class C family)
VSGDLAVLVRDTVGHPRAGLAFGVIAGKEEAIVGFGRARSEDTALPDGSTIFEIGSITKVVAGILLARLVLDGVVKLDDRVSSDLGREPFVPGDPALLALATHGTGLPNVPKGFAWREIAFVLRLRESETLMRRSLRRPLLQRSRGRARAGAGG